MTHILKNVVSGSSRASPRTSPHGTPQGTPRASPIIHDRALFVTDDVPLRITVHGVLVPPEPKVPHEHELVHTRNSRHSSPGHIIHHDPTDPSVHFENIDHNTYGEHAVLSFSQLVCIPPERRKKTTDLPNFRQVVENLGCDLQLLADFIGLSLGVYLVVDRPVPFLKGRFSVRQLHNVMRNFIVDVLLCTNCRSDKVVRTVSMRHNVVTFRCRACGKQEDKDGTRLAARVLLLQAQRRRHSILF